MACRITDDVIDALQHCRLKAFYKLGGEVGSRCSYESLLIEQRVNAQRKAIEKIRREYSETDVATHRDLSVAILRKGTALTLPATNGKRSPAAFPESVRAHRSYGDFRKGRVRAFWQYR